MLSDWLVNGWEDSGMVFPGLHPFPGSLLTLCALRKVGSFFGTQIPHLGLDGLERPS